jgi:ASC-1-like (ASCH) protein
MRSFTLKFRAVDKVNFENVRSGIKSIETRAATVRYQPIEVGDELVFSCDGDSFSKKVAKKYHWPSIDAMVKEIDFKKVMPKVDSVEEMRKRYASYPDYEQKIEEFGLLGFELA